jgi:hypothetical protein
MKSHVQLQRERAHRTHQRVMRRKKFGSYPVQRSSTQALQSIYEPGDCLLLHDDGASLYVPRAVDGDER